MTGYSKRELLSMDYESITYPEDRPTSLALARRVFRGDARNAVFETRCLRKDGGICWVRESIAAMADPESGLGNCLAISEDISPWKSGGVAVEAANQRIRQLSMDLLRVQDEERSRIARELHDGAAQLLAALSMNLVSLRDAGIDRALHDRFLDAALELAAECSRGVRTLSYLLHPPLLEEMGLAVALRSHVERFRRVSGIQVEIRIAPDFGRLEADAELALFRIVQEGLANVHRHSGSALAVVSLYRSGDEVVLEVIDWGRGLDKTAELGLGLTGMRERTQLLGGHLDISSSRSGTTIAARLPLRGKDEQDANSRR